MSSNFKIAVETSAIPCGLSHRSDRGKWLLEEYVASLMECLQSSMLDIKENSWSFLHRQWLYSDR